MPHLPAQALDALKRRDFAAARAAMIAYGQDHAMEFPHLLARGLAELGLHDWNAAAATFADVTRRYPDQAQGWLNLALAYENLGRLGEAAMAYESCLRLKPDQAEVCCNLSNIYRRLNRIQEAESMARRALDLGAPRVQALNILVLAVRKSGRYTEAQAVLQEALALAPGDTQSLTNAANLATDRLDFAAAWPLFAAARKGGDEAQIRYEEGLARLLAGDYAAGWALHEARLELPRALRTVPPCPRWQGQDVRGKKILLLAEQGFGDVIQFCRYGRLLAEAGAELIWSLPPPLVRLLQNQVPGQIFAEGTNLPVVDFYLPLLSLPLVTGKLQPESMPAKPYLMAPTTPLLPISDKKRKIGLVWAGSPTHERDRERSLHLSQLAPLFEKAEVDFYALFLGPALEQIGSYPVRRLDHLMKDFADTSGLLKQLDLLITVDTAVAHLAGALGVTTYLLLTHCPDWRWGTAGETTPWYDSVRLFRQPAAGDWGSVVRQVTAQI